MIGCLVIEQTADSRPQPKLEVRSEMLAEHVGAVLWHAHRHDRILFLRLWQTLGHMREWFHGRKLAKTLAIIGGVAAVVAVLCLVPWDYRVVGKGKLMPVRRQKIFAPENGNVIKIAVKDGDKVKANALLVKLHNEQLIAELHDNESKWKQSSQQSRSYLAEEDAARHEGDRKAELQADAGRLKADLEWQGLEKIVKILESASDSLEVRSPIDGTVASFQLDQILQDRPVQQGELLLDIMDETGPWQLELEVEGNRMGHLLRGLLRASRPQAGGRIHSRHRPRIDLHGRSRKDRQPLERFVRTDEHLRNLRLHRQNQDPQPADRSRGPGQNQLRQAQPRLRPLRRRDRIHPPAALALNRPL